MTGVRDSPENRAAFAKAFVETALTLLEKRYGW